MNEEIRQYIAKDKRNRKAIGRSCQKRDCPTEEVQTKARRASEKSANMEKEVNRWQRMEELLWSRLVDRLSSALKGEI